MKPGSLKIVLLTMLTISGVFFNAVSGAAESPLTVDEAVSIALEKNLNLRLQKNEVAAGRGLELVEKGAFDPFFEAGVSSREQNTTSLFTGGEEKEEGSQWSAAIKKKMTTGTEVALSWANDFYDTDSNQVVLKPYYNSALGIGLSQPLWKGNSREAQTAGVRAAAKYTEATNYFVEVQAANLAARVKNAYWDLVFTRQHIEVKKLSLKLARNLRDDTARKIESGVLAAVDIYQPDAEIARREELLIAAERDIASAEDNLKLLMNSLEWQQSIIPGDLPAAGFDKPELGVVLQNALNSRPDIRAAELLVDRAEIMAFKAEDDLKPSLVLSGTAGITGDDENFGDSLDDSFADPKFSWQVGLTFQLPLGNRSSRGALVRAKAELDNARDKAELLRQEVTREAREAVRNVDLAVKSIEATRKTGLASQKRLEAEQAKFEVGQSTANDVLVFQDSYAQALIGEKRALIDLAKAKAELERVQGIVSVNGRHMDENVSELISMAGEDENRRNNKIYVYSWRNN